MTEWSCNVKLRLLLVWLYLWLKCSHDTNILWTGYETRDSQDTDSWLPGWRFYYLRTYHFSLFSCFHHQHIQVIFHQYTPFIIIFISLSRPLHHHNSQQRLSLILCHHRSTLWQIRHNIFASFQSLAIAMASTTASSSHTGGDAARDTATDAGTAMPGTTGGGATAAAGNTGATPAAKKHRKRHDPNTHLRRTDRSQFSGPQQRLPSRGEHYEPVCRCVIQ